MAIDLGELVVRLRADMKQFTSGLTKAQEKMKTFSAKLQGHMRANAQAMKSFGRQMTFRLTLPIIALAAASVKAGADIEEAFIGVRKTVDATEAEFAKLSAGFEEMALRTPIAITELIKLGEVAGQLGIQTANILSFSETMAQLGVTTDLSSEQAASSLARLANITQMSQGDFDRLGSTIVALGNNLATTESEIVNMGLRLAGAGATIGLTEAQILSFGAAMSSLGIRAESGGSSFSRVMLEMNTAVLSGTKELALFAKVAGKTAADFAKSFKEDPAEALASFIDGLAKVREEGGDVAEVMRRLGLSNIRIIDTFLRLSGSGDLLRNSLRLGSEAWKENTALVEEAEKKFKSTWSQIKLMLNALKLVGKELFTTMKPALISITASLGKFFKWLGKASEGTKKMIIAIGLIAASAGPAIFMLASLSLALNAVTLSALKAGFAIGLIASAVLDLTKTFTGAGPGGLGALVNQFKIVEQAAANFVLNLRTGWAFMEFGFKQAVAGMRIAWDVAINAMKLTLADLLEGFGKLPFAKKLADAAKEMRESVSTVGTDALKANVKELAESLKVLEEARKEIFLDIELKFGEKVKSEVETAAQSIDEFIADVKKKFDSITVDTELPFFDFDPEKFNDIMNSWLESSRDLGTNLADAFTSGLDQLSEGITQLLFEGEADFAAFANSIARTVVQTIIQSAIATGVQSILGGAGGGIGAAIFHGGGMVGSPSPSRVVPASMFIGAPRLHGGLADDEFAAIVQKGEVVLNKDNVAEMKQGGGGGPSMVINVSAVDAAGVSNFFKKNRRQLSNALGLSRSENSPARNRS